MTGFGRQGVWGGGFDGKVMVDRALDYPFYDTKGKMRSVQFSGQIPDRDFELARISGDYQSDMDLILKQSRERRERIRMREVPDPPPNTLKDKKRKGLGMFYVKDMDNDWKRVQMSDGRIFIVGQPDDESETPRIVKRVANGNAGLPFDMDPWGRRLNEECGSVRGGGYNVPWG